jgi:Flp pilus assembly pilin Flp
MSNAIVTQPKKLKLKKRGQGMTEYIIIVALIAIAAIGVITLFGDNVRQLFAASAQALAGNDTVSNQGQTAQQSTLKKNLSNFGTNNAY